MTTTLYLVRHCEAMGNIRRIFQGHTDEEISENGRCHNVVILFFQKEQK